MKSVTLVSYPRLLLVFLVFGLSAGVVGSVLAADTVEIVSVTTTELCDFGFADAPGSDTEAETDSDNRSLRVKAEGTAAPTVFAKAEFGVAFVPEVSFPAKLRVATPFKGTLTDSAAPRSRFRIDMILIDHQSNEHLVDVVIASETKPPPVNPGTASKEDQNAAGEMSVELEGNREYRLMVRVETRARGALSEVDFFDGDKQVGVGCVEIVPELEDEDEDGIFDLWETSGIDVDGGGDDLPANGLGQDFRGVPIVLQPKRKDILVEIDYFDCKASGSDCAAGDNHSHRPRVDALTEVVEAFANAPVDNPDGSTGINLWLVLDQPLPHQVFCDLDAVCFDVIKDNNLVPAGSQSDTAALAARRLIFHYNLWVHDKAANGSTGESDGGCDGNDTPKWGDDFVVSLGSRSVGPNGDKSDQAGTFMHELGHNLGLCHGGQDNDGCKPNYQSVMSYSYQTRGLLPTGGFDYSREKLPDLNEDNLDEAVGIQNGALWTWFGPLQDVDGDGKADRLFGSGSGAINWNWNFDPTGAPIFEQNIKADINNLDTRGCRSSPGDKKLAGADDWGKLIYDFRNSAFYPSGHNSGADDELTSEDFDRINAATYWQRRNPRFDYAAKLICGVQGADDVLRLTRGAYGTTVNILNNGRRDAEIEKRLALAFPPAAQMPGNTYTVAIDRIPAGHAIKVDCDDIRERLFPEGFPEGYMEGFITLESDERLEVVGVYTVASVDQSGRIIGGSSIDIEHVTGSRRPPVADLAIKKAAEILVSGPTSEIRYTVTVTNNGPAKATGIEVRDEISMQAGWLADLTILDATHGAGWSIIEQGVAGASLNAQIASLLKGESATLRFRVVTVVRLPPSTVARNHAEVESGSADANLFNNSVSVTTEVPL